jgi:hypothetical protein|tara:strand:+ start:282 stop:590 length:309 start_codon:yes stop_codon:yes gene_type:complete
MAVKIVRLKSGEDVVADIDENADTITMENPTVIVPMSDPNSEQIKMGVAPWAPFIAKQKVEISRDWIVFIADADEALARNYKQQYGSGIVVPDVSTTSQLNG